MSSEAVSLPRRPLPSEVDCILRMAKPTWLTARPFSVWQFFSGEFMEVQWHCLMLPNFEVLTLQQKLLLNSK